jgi:hypothetical protein
MIGVAQISSPRISSRPISTGRLSAPDEQSLLRTLGGAQPVKRAVVAALGILPRRIGAQAGIAQFLSAQSPMHPETEGRIIRPPPRQKVVSRSSANAVSIASIAAFTATAWWTIGISRWR